MHPLKSRTAPPLELKCTPSDLELHPLKIVSIKVRVLCHKNPTNFVGFFVATEEGFLRNKIRGPQKILLYFWGKGAHKQKSEHKFNVCN